MVKGLGLPFASCKKTLRPTTGVGRQTQRGDDDFNAPGYE